MDSFIIIKEKNGEGKIKYYYIYNSFCFWKAKNCTRGEETGFCMRVYLILLFGIHGYANK